MSCKSDVSSVISIDSSFCLSPYVGEMFRRQNFVRTGHIDVSTTSKVIISAKNNKRMLSGVDSFHMFTASLLFPLDAPIKVCTTRLVNVN